jgi:hypothetical protein
MPRWKRLRGQLAPSATTLHSSAGLVLRSERSSPLHYLKAEAKVVGQASDRVKQAAGKAVQTSFEAAKDAAVSAVDAAPKSVADADLGEHASRMVSDDDPF